MDDLDGFSDLQGKLVLLHSSVGSGGDVKLPCRVETSVSNWNPVTPESSFTLSMSQTDQHSWGLALLFHRVRPEVLDKKPEPSLCVSHTGRTTSLSREEHQEPPMLNIILEQTVHVLVSPLGLFSTISTKSPAFRVSSYLELLL